MTTLNFRGNHFQGVQGPSIGVTYSRLCMQIATRCAPSAFASLLAFQSMGPLHANFVLFGSAVHPLYSEIYAPGSLQSMGFKLDCELAPRNTWSLQVQQCAYSFPALLTKERVWSGKGAAITVGSTFSDFLGNVYMRDSGSILNRIGLFIRPCFPAHDFQSFRQALQNVIKNWDLDPGVLLERLGKQGTVRLALAQSSASIGVEGGLPPFMALPTALESRVFRDLLSMIELSVQGAYDAQSCYAQLGLYLQLAPLLKVKLHLRVDSIEQRRLELQVAAQWRSSQTMQAPLQPGKAWSRHLLGRTVMQPFVIPSTHYLLYEGKRPYEVGMEPTATDMPKKAAEPPSFSPTSTLSSRTEDKQGNAGRPSAEPDQAALASNQPVLPPEQASNFKPTLEVISRAMQLSENFRSGSGEENIIEQTLMEAFQKVFEILQNPNMCGDFLKYHSEVSLAFPKLAVFVREVILPDPTFAEALAILAMPPENSRAYCFRNQNIFYLLFEEIKAYLAQPLVCKNRSITDPSPQDLLWHQDCLAMLTNLYERFQKDFAASYQEDRCLHVLKPEALFLLMQANVLLRLDTRVTYLRCCNNAVVEGEKAEKIRSFLAACLKAQGQELLNALQEAEKSNQWVTQLVRVDKDHNHNQNEESKIHPENFTTYFTVVSLQQMMKAYWMVRFSVTLVSQATNTVPELRSR